MIVVLDTYDILVDLQHNGFYQTSLNALTSLDVRRQICEQNLDGYSLKINPQFWHLFDEDDKIEEFVVNIDADGKVDKWFPEYKLNKEYDSVGVFSERLEVAKKLMSTQRLKNNTDE